MSASAQAIINYFAENFAFLEELFRFSKNDNFFISTEVLHNRCTSKNINIKRLEEYKIAKPLADGSYELNKKFTDFIAFLIEDFRLDLPESIKKYKHAIKEIYEQITQDNLSINKEKTTNQIIELSNALINELKDFDAQIDANTSQLFAETLIISQNKNNLDYIDRLKKASDLINNYIQPLNNILSTQSHDSFIKQLSQISHFANLQRNEQNDVAFRQQFERLYQFIQNINQNILKKSSIMAKEVTPLIDRLRTDSQIMKGVNTFLLRAKQKQKNKYISLSILKSKQSRTIYATDFQLNAKNIFGIFKNKTPINLSNNNLPVPQDLWIFDKKTYKEKLLQALPIDNFFGWCYAVLYQENQANISSEKFYYLSSLLFEKEIEADFLKTKFEINLTDYILTVPHININLLKNEN